MIPVQGDSSSYLSHALTIGLDFDLDYSNEPVSNQFWNKFRAVPSHPIGAGILAAPFVSLFSIVDRATHHPIISDHKQYQSSWSFFGFIFSASVYFMLSLLLYIDAIKKMFRDISPELIFLVLAGSGIMYYVLTYPVMSHAFEFFALSLLFWSAVNICWYEVHGLSCKTYVSMTNFFALVCGVAVSLNILIRPANLNVILLPHILLTVAYLTNNISSHSYKKTNLKLLVSLMLSSIPYGLLNLSLYGTIWPSHKQMYGMSMHLPIIDSKFEVSKVLLTWFNLLPNILKVFFSSEFGLLYSFPVAIFGIVLLLIKLKSFVRERFIVTFVLLLMVLAYACFPLSIVLFWRTTGSAYGYRYLYSLFPLAMFGYIWWYSEANISTSVIRRGIHYVFVILCVFSICSQLFFHSNANEKLKASEKINVYGVKHLLSANGYTTALVNELYKPKAWIILASDRLPGFLAVKMLPILSIDTNKMATAVGINSNLLAKKKEAIKRLENAPYQMFLQIIFLSFFWLIAGFALFRCAGLRQKSLAANLQLPVMSYHSRPFQIG
jgi:hypothetical protein